MDQYTYRRNKLLLSVLKEIISEKKGLFLFLLAIFTLVIGSTAKILTPLFFKEIIEILNGTAKNYIVAITWLFLYGITWVLDHLSNSIEEISVHRIKERCFSILLSKIINKLFYLSLNFFLTQKIGRISNVIVRLKQDLAIIIWGVVFFIIPLVIELIITIIILSQYFSVYYIMLLLSILFLLIIYTLVYSKKVFKYREKAIEIDKEFDAKVVDYIQNYEFIKTNNLIKYITKSFKTKLKNREDTQVLALSKYSYIYIGQGIIIGLGFILLIYLLGKDVLNHKVSIGEFVMFHGYLIQFIAPISMIGYFIRDIKRALIDIREGIQIFLQKPEIMDLSDSYSLNETDKISIEFKNVYFRYKNKVILDNISFKVNPGEKMIIMGRTGMGKSTIIKLLLRLCDVGRGEILINNINIKNIKLASIYKVLGVVAQDISLFNDTLYNNIKLANVTASDSQIKIVIKKVGLGELYNQCNKKNQVIGERGIKLSGGEKQRISIARLFLKNSAVCLLDEPVSSLDNNTKKKIIKNLIEFFKHKTAIIVTHNKNDFKHYDKKILIKDGKIIAE